MPARLFKLNRKLVSVSVLAAVMLLCTAALLAVNHQQSQKIKTTSPAAPKMAARQVPQTDNAASYDAFYFPMDVSADKIRQDLTFYKSQGVQSIYVSLSEREIIDRTKMDKVVSIGHELGLRVYANPYIGGTFSGDEGQSRQFYLDSHPDSDQVSRFGLKTGHMPSINDPNYRQYLKGRIAQLSKMGFDGLEFDEPEAGDRGVIIDNGRIGVDYYPYDHFSQSLFKQKYGYDMPGFENTDSLQFRRDSMLNFTTEMINYARQAKPDWIIILVLQPDFNDGDIAGTNNWKDYAAIQNLDGFLIDPYWYPEVDRGWDWFLSNLNAFRTATKGSHVKTGIWVRAFGLTDNYQVIGQTLDYAKKYVNWRSVWITDNLKNNDPAAAWSQISQSFHSQ